MYERKVAVSKCKEYNEELILGILKDQFENLGIKKSEIEGKKVVLKPNLLLAYSPEKAATTHPDVVTAAARLMKDLGAAEIMIAESPGGLYTEKTLSTIYETTGMKSASEAAGVPLNYDVSSVQLHMPDGRVSKTLNIIKPVADCDIIVDLCKLKTHSLAGVTCAAKNLFGLVPGITKFEMHARFKNQDDFIAMVVDLNEEIMKEKKVISICDAVMCMEGSGPSAGQPRFGGLILSSRNQFALDLLVTEIIGMSGKVKMNELAEERGLCPSRYEELEIVGESIDKIRIPNFVPPDTKLSKKFDLIPPFLQPRPAIDKNACRGCGLCVRSCPQKTIVLKDGKAKIFKENCIKCYCCQELCTFKAVRIKKSIIYKVFK